MHIQGGNEPFGWPVSASGSASTEPTTIHSLSIRENIIRVCPHTTPPPSGFHPPQKNNSCRLSSSVVNLRGRGAKHYAAEPGQREWEMWVRSSWTRTLLQHSVPGQPYFGHGVWAAALFQAPA